MQKVSAESDVKFTVINAPVITDQHLNEHFIAPNPATQQNEPCPIHTSKLQVALPCADNVNQIVKIPSEVFSVYNQFLQHSNMSMTQMDSSQKASAGGPNLMPVSACDPPGLTSSVEASRSQILTNLSLNKVEQRNGPKTEGGHFTSPAQMEPGSQRKAAKCEQFSMLRDKHSMYLKTAYSH